MTDDEPTTLTIVVYPDGTVKIDFHNMTGPVAEALPGLLKAMAKDMEHADVAIRRTKH